MGKEIKAKEIANYLKEVFEGDKLYRSNFRGWDFEMIMKHGEFDENDVVLDTGAMHSYFSIYLAQFVKTVITTDDLSWAERDYFSKSGLPEPKEWMRIVSEKTNGRVLGEVADVRALPYATENFDKVLSISTIEHIDDDAKAMYEMMRVLKPGGLLLMTTEYGKPKPYSEIDGSYYRIYDKQSLSDLIGEHKPEKIVFAPTRDADLAARGFTTVFCKLRK